VADYSMQSAQNKPALTHIFYNISENEVEETIMKKQKLQQKLALWPAMFSF